MTLMHGTRWIAARRAGPGAGALAAVLVAATLAAGSLAGTARAETAAQIPQIVVTGEGRVEAEPDLATITLGARSEALTAADALAATSAATARILDQLAAAGIEPRDIQTASLTLAPRYDNSRVSSSTGRLTGYVASNTIRVRVRDMDTLGTRLDAAVSAGGNRFDGLIFGLQDPGPLTDEARRRAVADARRKAELYAEAAGVTLGPILSITDQGGFGVPIVRSRGEMMMAESAMPVAAGEIEVGASVVITWGLIAP